jgi:hypothetical protein
MWKKELKNEDKDKRQGTRGCDKIQKTALRKIEKEQ